MPRRVDLEDLFYQPTPTFTGAIHAELPQSPRRRRRDRTVFSLAVSDPTVFRRLHDPALVIRIQRWEARLAKGALSYDTFQHLLAGWGVEINYQSGNYQPVKPVKPGRQTKAPAKP